MRVCFASYEIFPTTPGGAGVLIAHATRELLEAGAEVLLLLDTPREAFERFDRVDRRELPNPENCHATWVGDLAAGWPVTREMVPNLFQWQSARFAFALESALRRFPVDIVEFFDFAGAGYYPCMVPLFDLPRPCARPLMQVRTHGPLEVIDEFDHGAPRGVERQILHRLERGAIALADRVVVPTLAFAAAHAQDPYGLPDARTVVVTPPRDSSGATSPPGAGGQSILFVGRIAALKGVEQFVRVVCDLLRIRPGHPLQAELFGGDSQDGPGGKSLTQHLLGTIPASLRGRFHFMGHRSRSDVESAYRRAAFAVFPNRVESYCYAIHEAADAGVPIIARDLAVFREHFRDGEHALFYRDDAELLGAMVRLVDQPSLRNAIGRSVPTRPGARSRGLAVVGPPRDAVLHASSPGADVLGLVLGRGGDDPYGGQSLRPAAVRPLTELQEHSAHAGPVALLIAGSQADPAWLARCVAALHRRPDVAFAGSWTRAPCGPVRVDPSLLDLDSSLSLADVALGPSRFHGIVFRNMSAFRRVVLEGERTGWVRHDEPPAIRGVILHEPLVTLPVDPVSPDEVASLP